MDIKEIRGIGLIRLRMKIIEEPLECGNEPPGFISHGGLLTIRLDSYRISEI